MTNFPKVTKLEKLSEIGMNDNKNNPSGALH